MARAALAAVLLAAALGLYLQGVERQHARNNDVTGTDQRTYLRYAQRLRESGYAYTIPRNRMPLYPLVQALFLPREGDLAASFEAGKRVNAALSLAVLAGAFAVFRLYLTLWEASLAIAVAAYTVLVFKAPWVQAEVLFYGLQLGVFVLLFELARRPRWPLALAAGVLAALAHLTKASLPPAVLLGLACLGAHLLLDLREARCARSAGAWRRPAATLLAGALFAGAFLGVLSPYLSTSKRMYGRYFYNVNSTFYMWCESWDDARARVRAAGDRAGWPELAPEEIPGPRKYLREHSWAQIGERIAHGWRTHRRNVWTFYPAGPFLDLYAGFLAIVALVQVRALPARLLARRGWIATGFVLAYFLGYGLLYVWYVPIGGGARFILALYLPALFALAWAASARRLAAFPWRLRGRDLDPLRSGRALAAALGLVVAARLAWYLATRYAGWTAWLYGGA